MSYQLIKVDMVIFKSFSPTRLGQRIGWTSLAFAMSVLTLSPAAAMEPAGRAGARVAAVDGGGLSDRLIIKFREDHAARVADPSARVAVAVAGARAGIRITRLRGMAGSGAHVLKLDRRLDIASLQRLANEIQSADPAVEYVEPDRLLKPMWLPNDPLLAQQWHYTEAKAGINLPAAWDMGTGAGVVVAVIDTGVRPHPDLVANLLPGYDFIGTKEIANDGDGRDADASDPGDWNAAGDCGEGSPATGSSWHGTHVAGTIAASTNNGIGVAGVAPGARILPLRVLGRCGGYTSDITDAIVWAVGGPIIGLPINRHPAKVLNLSLGGAYPCGLTMLGAVAFARLSGAVVVAAAGNSGVDVAGFTPASCPWVIPVAAVDRNGARAFYSNFGAAIAVAAPGGGLDGDGQILSTWNEGGQGPAADAYQGYIGTSMAAPHVSGVVALMLGRNPSLTPAQVEQKLKSSAAARGFPVACSQCGSGIVDAQRAMVSAGVPVTAVSEIEPNDTQALARPVTALPARVKGTIGSFTDVDHYQVDVPAGKALTAALTPNTVSDYDLVVFDSRGTQVAQSLLGQSQVDRVRVSNASDKPKTLVLRVYRYRGITGPAGTYSLSLSHD